MALRFADVFLWKSEQQSRTHTESLSPLQESEDNVKRNFDSLNILLAENFNELANAAFLRGFLALRTRGDSWSSSDRVVGVNHSSRHSRCCSSRQALIRFKIDLQSEGVPYSRPRPFSFITLENAQSAPCVSSVLRSSSFDLVVLWEVCRKPYALPPPEPLCEEALLRELGFANSSSIPNPTKRIVVFSVPGFVGRGLVRNPSKGLKNVVSNERLAISSPR